MYITLKNARNKEKINTTITPSLRNQAEDLSIFNPRSAQSFKGIFYNPHCKSYNSKELIELANKHLGPNVKDLYERVKGSDLDVAKKMFSVENDTKVTFQNKSILKLVIDGVLYPFVQLPFDIANGGIKLIGKIDAFKGWSERMQNGKFLSKMRQRSKIEADVNALKGVFETIEEARNKGNLSSELFQKSVKTFDVKTGNYDTKHERSWCRMVSGGIPALFLANDAYNLSMMYKSNEKEAKKEQKTRFRQEVVRVGLNAYLTLITLGALQKLINKSSIGIILNTAVTVLFTEAIARLAGGKSIKKLTPEQAKEINAKNQQFVSRNNAVVVDNDKDKNTTEKKVNSKKHEPLLTVESLLKASVLAAGAGFALRGLNGFKSISSLFRKITEPIIKLNTKLTKEVDYKVSKAEFKKITDKLREIGYDVLADKYEEVASKANKVFAFDKVKNDSNVDYKNMLNLLKKDKKEPQTEDIITFIESLKDDEYGGLAVKYKNELHKVQQDGFIHLGQKEKKHAPLVEFVKSPVIFAYRVAKFPFHIADNIYKMVLGNKNKNISDNMKKDVEALSTSVEKMLKYANVDKAETFKSFVGENISKSFNADNVSSLANSELANLAKTSATASTLWFLMTDNYNMAMLKSNGEDKQGAEEKFKGRFVQEMSRLFYQTMFINFFNNSFKSQYHSSLTGVTWITTLSTFISEIVNRKSIGMPVMTHNQSELKRIEDAKDNATGFLGSYYNFMSRLTGRKTLAEREAEKHN